MNAPVRAEESAAVRSKLLDGRLRRHRSNRQLLSSHRFAIAICQRFQSLNFSVLCKRLNDALRDQRDSQNKRQRQQDVENSSS